MISSAGYKKVQIQITTFRKNSKKQSNYKMDKEKFRPSVIGDSNRRFICSVCLNSNKPQKCNPDNGRIAKPCPICCKAGDAKNEKRCFNTVTKHDSKNALFHTYDHSKTYNNNAKDTLSANMTPIDRKDDKYKKINTKTVQTSQTDLTQDLSLLKEVLTVFKTQKHIDVKSKNSKTVVMKDVSVATETQSKNDIKPKLTISKTFQLSIEDMGHSRNTDVKVYSQPDNKKSSHYSIDLIKHKSSSIPQMKLEELKYSLKEKTKSKDAIEEVNRMFATVRRNELSENLEDHNRPVVRNGPRVLPVVKTNLHQEHTKGNSDIEVENKTKDAMCKCCQTNNLMSAGDSFIKHECCYHRMLHEGTCEKCVYMLCCHYQKHGKVETGALVCERCRKPGDSDEKHEVHGENHQCDHF